MIFTSLIDQANLMIYRFFCFLGGIFLLSIFALYAQSAEYDQVIKVESIEAPFVKYDERIDYASHYNRTIKSTNIILDNIGQYDVKARDRVIFRSGISGVSGVPMPVGIGRNIEVARDQRLFGKLLTWNLMEDGSRISAVSFKSPGAVGNRLILDIASIDPRASLLFRDANDVVIYQVTGLKVLETLSVSGHNDKKNTLFAGPYIDGETSTLEVFLPAGVSPDTVRLAVPALSHIFISPHDEELNSKVGESSSCQIDVACKPEWNDPESVTSYADSALLG